MKKDIIIIGGGASGLSLACSLASTNIKIGVIEKKSISYLEKPLYDGREIALTHFSKKILKKINVWSQLSKNEISPIKEAKVLDGNSPYALHFDRNTVNQNALGYLVSNHIILKKIYDQVITKKNIEIFSDANILKLNTNDEYASIILDNKKQIYAPLIIGADSRFSKTRKDMGISANMKDFGRVAIVCRMKHEKIHNNIAYECFHYGETLAVLPLNGKISSIIMTIPTEKSEEMISLRKSQFNKYVCKKFKNKLGKMELIDKRFIYPLVSVYADNFVAKRFALIGDAAVGMHPVTAHGFNLGLRGQNTLSKHIISALMLGLDIGSKTILEKYQLEHRHATKPLYLGTNAIVKLYTDDSFLSKILRKTVLRIGNNFIPAKQKIINQLTETSR